MFDDLEIVCGGFKFKIDLIVWKLLNSTKMNCVSKSLK